MCDERVRRFDRSLLVITAVGYLVITAVGYLAIGDAIFGYCQRWARREGVRGHY